MKGFQVRAFGVSILSAGLLVGTQGFAQDAKPVPDAQIESNVLRALASAPELSTQNIQTAVVYGTVTISGNVHNEEMRKKAEDLVARTEGVKKVVDELVLGDTPPPADAPPNDNAGGPPQQGDPAEANMAPMPGSPEYGAGQYNGQQPLQGQAPPPQYSQDGSQPPPRRPMYSSAPPPQGYAPQGGQVAGMPVTVPAGALLRVRINRGLYTKHTVAGTPFDATVLNDVAGDGAIAIPRGASVQGVVVESKAAGALKGEGHLALQINSISLGGKVYPLQSDVWAINGNDKTTSTVNHTVAGGAVGALFGAILGGGKGAAIGAGVGAGVGLASSADSAQGQVIVQPEAVLMFHVAQPTTLATVSEAEMARLSYAAGAGGQPAPRGYYRRGVWYPYPPPPGY